MHHFHKIRPQKNQGTTVHLHNGLALPEVSPVALIRRTSHKEDDQQLLGDSCSSDTHVELIYLLHIDTYSIPSHDVVVSFESLRVVLSWLFDSF